MYKAVEKRVPGEKELSREQEIYVKDVIRYGTQYWMGFWYFSRGFMGANQLTVKTKMAEVHGNRTRPADYNLLK